MRMRSFMAAYKARFAKPAKSSFDAHRPLRADENLDLADDAARKPARKEGAHDAIGGASGNGK